jgi:two-component system, OmpR family, sensor histidine kinase VicK
LQGVYEFSHRSSSLEGIKANFAVRNKEYVGITSLKKVAQQKEDEQLADSQSHIIYTNVSGIIEQQQYLFNSLWKSCVAI